MSVLNLPTILDHLKSFIKFLTLHMKLLIKMVTPLIFTEII